MADRKWNLIYDVLVGLAGAHEDDRASFIAAHEKGCEEYRFQGALGFGGKFRSTTWTVDYYREDTNAPREIVVARTNGMLSVLKKALTPVVFTGPAASCEQTDAMGNGCKDSWWVGGNYGHAVCRNPDHHRKPS